MLLDMCNGSDSILEHRFFHGEIFKNDCESHTIVLILNGIVKIMLFKDIFDDGEAEA